jgi:signal transduction histidine kinase
MSQVPLRFVPRFVPRSITNRTTLVLIAGLLLVMVLSAVISHIVVQDDRDSPNRWQLIERMHAVAQVLIKLPVTQRKQFAEEITDDNIRVQWFGAKKGFSGEQGFSENKPPVELVQDWGTDRFERFLSQRLSDLQVRSISTGHLPPAENVVHNAIHKGPIAIALQLNDRSWLLFSSDKEPHNRNWLLRLVTGLVVFGGGITLLAVLTTRRIIKPLETFAEASQRFGINVDAPPLEETGPTEIKRATQAFNQMQRRIRMFVQERMQMIAAISHDLKTPLTRLQLRTDFIEDEIQRRKALDDLKEMQVILDSTLSFAREHSNNETRTQVDLAVLIQSLCDDYADSGHTVSYQGPEHLTYHCAPVSIRRALSNIINNAIRYGTQADVELTHNAHQITISVADSGTGIPEEKREQVFSPFFRLEKSRNRATGGTGLGLAVARTVVRQHGGDIELTDHRSGGLLVIIALPEQQ